MVFMTRFRRTDEPGQHVLLQVEDIGGKGFDLKLVGSEHEHLYHGRIRGTSLSSSQASSYDGTGKEWQAVLRKLLLNESSSSSDLRDVEAVAAITGTKMNITVRKNVGGITQRLGALSLDQDDEREEVSIFDWVQSALATTEQYSANLIQAEAASETHQARISSLEKQLDDLIAAKKEHEDELLQKFAALLNAKKLKIRDQQRLLAGKTASNGTPRDVRANRKDEPPESTKSRKGKRKATDDREEMEKMDMDGETTDEEGQEEQSHETPPPSDPETENESASANEGNQMQQLKGKTQKAASKQPDRDVAIREKANVTRSQTTKPPVDEETDSETDDEL